MKDGKMAQNTKAVAQKPADPTVHKNSSKKMLIGAIAALLLIIVAGAGWYFTKGKNDSPHAEEVKAAPPKAPIFVPLEPFTVNLQREVTDQYLQMGITLKLYESDVESKIKASLPEVRSKILQLLTTKTASELLTSEGKNKLVKEIISTSNAIIGIAAAPVQATPAVNPAGASAVSQADEANTKIQVAEAVTATEATHNPETKMPVEKKGVVDVLFTSFIIQ